MTRTNAASMDPRRRQRLIETAAREFAAAGYDGASLNSIIRECGMSKSSFYHFLESKAALFELVVREVADGLRRDLRVPDPAELAGPEFWERIAVLARQLLVAAEEQTWYADFGRLFYLPDTPPGASRELQLVLGEVAGWLDAVLAVGRKCGAVRRDMPASLQSELTQGVLAAMDRWSLTNMIDSESGALADVASLQVDVLRRLLSP